MSKKSDRFKPTSPMYGPEKDEFGNPIDKDEFGNPIEKDEFGNTIRKDGFVDRESSGTVAVSRDGELVGVGLSRDDAKNYVKEMSKAYPDSNFSIVPGGAVKPGDTEENPE